MTAVPLRVLSARAWRRVAPQRHNAHSSPPSQAPLCNADRFNRTTPASTTSAAPLVTTATVPLSRVAPYYQAHPARCGVVFYASANPQKDASLVKFVEAIGHGLKHARTPRGNRSTWCVVGWASRAV